MLTTPRDTPGPGPGPAEGREASPASVTLATPAAGDLGSGGGGGGASISHSGLPGLRYLVCLDFEATCEDGKQIQPQEIIEFPMIVIDTAALRARAAMTAATTAAPPNCSTSSCNACEPGTSADQHCSDNADSDNGRNSAPSQARPCPNSASLPTSPAPCMAPAVRRASTQAPPALPIVAQFHEFVRPLANPVLTPFCTALTSISQDVVDGADPFPAVFGRAQAFLRERGLAEHNAVVVTCGDWDLRMMLPRQAKLTAKLALQAQQTQVSRDQNHTQHAMHDGDGAPKQQPRAKVPIPAIFRRWINIKAAFASHFSETSRINGQRAGDAAPPPLPPAAAAASLSCMLRSLGWEFEGHHHLGLDDTRNIARIAAHMVATGWMPSKEQTRYA